MSNSLEQKLKAIRKSEGITQKVLAGLTGVSLGTIRNYETGFNTVGIQTLEAILHVPRFQKYTLWLMTGETAPVAGQISPALSPDGRGEMSDHHKARKVG
ncbi:helix-turn-helix domain-containing protein [Erwinia tracheiphila]|uniref:XRE family transcriptional regulator n=1 Tax=Erwinia tracheiphila TaxID=65700 RepID=A0A345CZN8_9GAMM|nr:helix-turn-helix transcriptional regulator [Erwinia tracheiphila]AXF78905.1 XRE family transcriptional regulator [Erwinia tracheiphila]UIA82975.1 helix-turn-helix domain-containing protein [Erwinia tracheiphila]UIA91555.1 helix-turn-helix domain-containing protein [Erwinia tracheiphila]